MADRIFAGVVVVLLIALFVFMIKCSGKQQPVQHNLKCTCVEALN